MTTHDPEPQHLSDAAQNFLKDVFPRTQEANGRVHDERRCTVCHEQDCECWPPGVHNGFDEDVRRIMGDARDADLIKGVFPSPALLSGLAWSSPGSDYDRPLPAFPTHALPGRLGEFARAVATYTQTPVDIAGLAILGCLSVAVGGFATVTGQWTEKTLNLFAVSVADSGDGKSRAFDLVAPAVYRLESRLRSVWKARYGDSAEDLEIAIKVRDRLIAKLAEPGDPAKRARLRAELDAAKETIRELAGPPEPVLLAGDVLAEGLGQMMHEHSNHVGIISSEGPFLGNILGRYNGGKPTLDLVLIACDASEPYRNRRVTRGNFEIERPSLALALSVQPVVIREAVVLPVAVERGLFNRFLLAAPPSMAGSRDQKPPHVDPDLIRHWYDSVDAAFRAVRPDEKLHDENGEPVPPVPLVVGPEAEDLHFTWRSAIEPRLDADSGDLAAIKGWIGRSGGMAYRISGLLHLAAGHSHKTLISVESMANALDIVDYAIPHTLNLLAGGTGVSASRLNVEAREVLGWLRRKGLAEFTVSDVAKGMKGRRWVQLTGADGVRKAVAELARAGWLASVQRQDAAGRQRPDGLFVVHPQVLRDGQ
ncbi:YfjI family protein [Nonomuraea sp. NPDC049646]|uniref:YfjI family protein n=1 Tax=unclassified Nonomuraea TaxID=2593643 RepID=UPI0037B68736